MICIFLCQRKAQEEFEIYQAFSGLWYANLACSLLIDCVVTFPICIGWYCTNIYNSLSSNPFQSMCREGVCPLCRPKLVIVKIKTMPSTRSVMTVCLVRLILVCCSV
jgi:hypothetical protein